jgi:hypothetical protein
MVIDLRNVSSTVLTLHESTKRLEDFSKCVGSKLSVNCFYGEKHSNQTIGFNISAYKMYQSVKPKCIVFEDDVLCTEHYNPLLNIPDDADLVYLGTSAWGIKNNISERNNIDIEKYNDDFYRISYMTSTHAMLFVSDTFYNDMIVNLGNLIESSPPTMPLDIHLANMQKDYRVYALAKPMFYQNSWHVDVTKYPLEKVYLEVNC